MVDILLATYNGEKYIQDLLSSIANQSYPNWRLIIRDDHSTDNTLAIIEEFKKHYKPGKIVVYQNETPMGQAKLNFMRLIGDSTGDYAMFCDQDDEWYWDKIEVTIKRMYHVERLIGADKPALVHTDMKVVDEELNVISESFRVFNDLPKEMPFSQRMIQNNVAGCSAMMNRTLVNELKLVKHPEKLLMHDHFAVLIAQAFGKVSFIDEGTIGYRQHESNSVGAADTKNPVYLWERFKRGGKGFKKDLKQSIQQIRYFDELYGQNLEDLELKKTITVYENLLKAKKLKRMYLLHKYQILKYGKVRQLMQLLWC